MSETKERCEVEQIERKKNEEWRKVENTPLEKRNKEHYEILEVKWQDIYWNHFG